MQRFLATWGKALIAFTVAAPFSMAQVPTTAPTRANATGPTPPFTLLNGSLYGCGVLSGGTTAGACISSNLQGGNYLNNALCLFRVNFPVSIFATRFRTEEWYDILSIGRAQYSGANGGEFLNTILTPVPTGTLIEWRSDDAVNFTGFELCARGYGATQPPTTSPTSAAPTPSGFTETFELVSGGEYGCAVISSRGAPGSCIMIAPQRSANRTQCHFRVLRETTLSVRSFVDYTSLNVLAIDGIATSSIGGSAVLEGRRVYPNQTVAWVGAFAISDPSFVICGNDTGVPLPPPPPSTTHTPSHPAPTPSFRVSHGEFLGCGVVAYGGPVGSCFTNGPGRHQPATWCVFEVLRAVRLHMVEFMINLDDFLVVDGTGYSGADGELLNGTLVPVGSIIRWRSDAGGLTEFVLCDGPRESQPPTSSPSSVADPRYAIPIHYRIPGCPPNAQINLSFVNPAGYLPNTLVYLCADQGLTSAEAFAHQFHPDTLDINLAYNRLTTLPAAALSGLARLQILNISFNALTELGSESLTQSPQLRELDASHNQITALPPGVFRTQSVLVSLDLSTNQISQMASTILQGLSSLALLQLDKNHLTRVEEYTFAPLRRIEKITLQGNAITFLAKDAFAGNQYIENISLHDNLLNSIDGQTFSNLGTVENVGLSWNLLRDVNVGTFIGLTALLTVSLDFNRLTRLQPHTFGDLSALKVLALGQNLLTTLVANTFSGLTALELLGLEQNPIVNIAPRTFSELTSLQLLNIGYSVLTTVPSSAFANLTSLTSLNIGYNGMTEGVFETIGQLPALQTLTLASSNVGPPPLDAFTNVSSLTVLLMSNASATTIPSGTLFPLTQLLNMDLSGNTIKSLECEVFTTQTQLEELYLSQNLLIRINSCTFAGLTSLKYLMLGENCITSVDDMAFHDLTRLIRLRLDNNRLTRLNAGIFATLGSLIVLWLDGNQLTSLPPDLFDFNSRNQLNYVTLENTGLRSLPSSALANIVGMGVYGITVSPNPSLYIRTALWGVECVGCTLGYTYVNQTASCHLPPFGPAPDRAWTTSIGSSIFGSIESAAVMYIGVAYSEPAPSLTPKSTAYVGYEGQFDQIEYTSTFEDTLITNITCGARATVLAGNTIGGTTRYRIRNPLYTRECTTLCGPEYLYDSPEAIYTFEVASGGANISFDTCLSNFVTALTVYAHGSNDSVLFYPNANRSILVKVFAQAVNASDLTNLSPTTIYARGRFPFSGGCGLMSANARTPIVTYPPGKYSVVIQGDPWARSRASGIATTSLTGRYVLQMNCEHPDQTIPPAIDKLGLRVDPITGAISATPTVEGNYTFNLTAVDAGGPGTTATIRQFAVQVRPRPVFHRNNRPFDYQPPLARLQIVARGWTYTLNPPTDSSNITAYFASATGPLAFSVLHSNSSVDLGDDVLISSTTGLIRMVLQSDGLHIVFVVASDNSRRINVTAPWSFEVRSPDDPWNNANGPNGQGCNGGAKVQSPSQNGSYTCDCTATDKTGPNCLEPRVSGPFVAIIVSLCLVAAALIVATRVLHLRRPTIRGEIKSLLKTWSKVDVGVHFESPPEVAREDLEVLQRLGEGFFGVVSYSSWHLDGKKFEVAVKQYHDTTEDMARQDFVKEAVFAHSLDHDNVCEVLGMCTTSTPNLLILEYCETSLKSNLETCDTFLMETLVQYLRDITAGMSYLAECRFVHRDLTADNVLISRTGLAKIADFGLIRPCGEDLSFHFETGRDRIRDRWTDPAVFDLRDAKSVIVFSEATDVWSFGIVAVEVFTKGALPYSNMLDNDEVINRVQKQGYRIPHERVSKCPLDLYQSVIAPSWDDQEVRPKFSVLGDRLDYWWRTNHAFYKPIPTHARCDEVTGEESADGYMDVSAFTDIELDNSYLRASASIGDDYNEPGRIGPNLCTTTENPVFEKSLTYQTPERYRPVLKDRKSKVTITQNQVLCSVCCRRNKYTELHRPKSGVSKDRQPSLNDHALCIVCSRRYAYTELYSAKSLSGRYGGPNESMSNPTHACEDEVDSDQK